MKRDRGIPRDSEPPSSRSWAVFTTGIANSDPCVGVLRARSGRHGFNISMMVDILRDLDRVMLNDLDMGVVVVIFCNA